jgi:hypothetical protein
MRSSLYINIWELIAGGVNPVPNVALSHETERCPMRYKIVVFVADGSAGHAKRPGMVFASLRAEYDCSYMMQGQFVKPTILL